MKPISLKFQAFGSYPETVEIDFVRLWQHGVFTITGANGAGKTTIFDAMVYALYNEMPGYREVADVRSHFADPSRETFVEFVFEVDGVRWRVLRKPTQMRPAKRGEGETEEKATVLLRRADEATGGITKITPATKEVERLIGLNAGQFQQVILIPQGKFEEVLKGDTAKRLEVLRQLFPVEIYKTFADEVLKKLRDDAKQTYAQVGIQTEGIRNNITGHIAAAHALLSESEAESTQEMSAEVDDALRAARDLTDVAITTEVVEEFLTILSEALASLVQQRDLSQSAADVLAERVQAADAVERDLADHQQRLAEAANFESEQAADEKREKDLARAGTANNAMPVITQLMAATTDVESARTAFVEAERSAQNCLAEGLAWPEEISSPALRSLLATAVTKRESGANAASEAKRLQEAKAQLEDARGALLQAQQGQEQWKTYLAAIKQEDIDLAAELTTLKPSEKKLSAVQSTLEQLEKELHALAEARNLDAKIKSATTAVTQAESVVAKTRDALEKAQTALALNAAAHAATLLRDGEACPTCGSMEHPSPAKRRKSVGEVDIDHLRVAHDAARDSLTEAKTSLAELIGAKSTKEIRTTAEVKEEIKAQKSEATTLEEQVARCAEIEARRKEIADDKDEANENLSEFKTDAATAAATLKGETALTKQITAFEGKHGELDAFVFDENVWNRCCESLELFIDAFDKQAAAKQSLDQAQQAVNPVYEQLDVHTPDAVAALCLSDEHLAAERALIQDRRTKRALVTKLIDEYVAAGKPLTLPDTKDLREQLTSARQLHARLSDRVGRVGQTTENLQRDLAAFSAQASVLETARQAYEEAETLYKVCSGQGGGIAAKMKLETWVLAYYLRQVVAQANVRMERLFGGRYQLSVADEAESQQGHFGLELEVFDAETGRKRSVRGMSNGETFKAALALALGLSDVVAMGENRRIDALFIDEGFGALDGPSREAVIEIFDRLQQTGRMVGLITHVTELQQALPLGISVRQGDADQGGGSSLEVHYPFG